MVLLMRKVGDLMCTHTHTLSSKILPINTTLGESLMLLLFNAADKNSYFFFIKLRNLANHVDMYI